MAYMLNTRNLVVASVNRLKFEEIKSVLAANPRIHPRRADRVVRNPETLRLVVDWKRPCLENAIAKARVLGRACHDPVLAESACLEVGEGGAMLVIPDDDLDVCYTTVPGGEPVRKALGLLKGEPRPAVLDSAVVLLIEGVMLHAIERVEGTIVPRERGHEGCGFDSIFVPHGATGASVPNPSNNTLAEMNANERFQQSPRAKAVRAVLEQLESRQIKLVRPQGG